MLLGSLAVLSKEPAFVLVHVVLLGSFLLERHKIISVWKIRSGFRLQWALVVYVLLAVLTIWVAFVSPTKGNRFFPMASHDLPHLVRERIEYYSAIYLSITARILLFSPMVFAFIRAIFARRIKTSNAAQFLLLSILAIVLALLFFQNIFISIAFVTFIFLVLAAISSAERQCPAFVSFVACLVIAIGALLFTISVVNPGLRKPLCLLPFCHLLHGVFGRKISSERLSHIARKKHSDWLQFPAFP